MALNGPSSLTYNDVLRCSNRTTTKMQSDCVLLLRLGTLGSCRPRDRMDRFRSYDFRIGIVQRVCYLPQPERELIFIC